MGDDEGEDEPPPDGDRDGDCDGDWDGDWGVLPIVVKAALSPPPDGDRGGVCEFLPASLPIVVFDFFTLPAFSTRPPFTELSLV